MRSFRVALAQIAPRLGDVEFNLGLHAQHAREAKRAGADVVVFPELSLTGYLLRDQVSDVALARSSPTFRKLAGLSRSIDFVAGYVEEAPGHLYFNAAGYFSRGRLVHLHRKAHLPTYGMFDEGRDFAAGDRIRSFRARFGPAGILVCEDVWHPMSAWLLAQQGAEVLFALSSGPTRGARPGRGITSVAIWHDLLRVTAQFQTSFVVYVNRVGVEDGLGFGGGSVVVDPFGRIVATVPALEEGMAVADLDGEVLRRARTAYPLLRDENIELVHREIVRIRTLRFDLPEPAPERAPRRTRRDSRPRSER